VSGTQAAALETVPTPIEPVPVFAAAPLVVNVPLPAGMFMKTAAPVSAGGNPLIRADLDLTRLVRAR